MKCPICNVDLQMTERQNVEIDYCPQCRGVWLDRGELDKIIEKSESSNYLPERKISEMPPTNSQQGYHGRHHNDHNSDYGYKKKHKKESLLGELFDF